MIKVKSVQLVSLSNNSGHYKPTREHLFNAVKLLIRELGSAGTNMAIVQFWGYAQEPGWVNLYETPWAAFGLNNRLVNPIHRMKA
jgi:hypothetical protein